MPQNYRIQEATEVLVDQSLGHAANLSGGVSIFAGDGTVRVEDTTDPQYLMDGATKALKLTITPGAVSTRIRPSFTIETKTHGDLRNLGVAAWVVPGSGSLDIFGLQFGDAALSNFFAWDARNGTGIGTWMYGKNHLHATRGWRTSTTGSPVYGSTSFARIRFDIRAVTGSGPVTIILGNVVKNFETRPQFCLVYDDQSVTQYTEAFAYMEPRGIVGSLAIASKFLDTSNCLTTAQINEMLAAGWSVHNHSHDHPVLTSQTAAFAKADALICKQALEVRGWNRNDIYVAPGAATNQASWDGIQEAGYRYNVVGDALSGYQDFNTTYGGILGTQSVITRCSNREANSAAGLAFFRTRMAEAIATGKSMGFIIHSITDTAGNLSPAHHAQLINDLYQYQQGGVVDVVNLETYVRRFTDSRLIRTV